MPTLFNVPMDIVVCNWLLLSVEYEYTTHNGLQIVVGRLMGLFYADDEMIGLRDLEWLQNSINVLIVIFRRVSVVANIIKSNTTTCQPG